MTRPLGSGLLRGRLTIGSHLNHCVKQVAMFAMVVRLIFVESAVFACVTSVTGGESVANASSVAFGAITHGINVPAGQIGYLFQTPPQRTRRIAPRAMNALGINARIVEFGSATTVSTMV